MVSERSCLVSPDVAAAQPAQLTQRGQPALVFV